MSKMNRIRIVNLSYNSNTIRVDDETLDLNGETTLLSLRNGGGKTVLVQMIISLFVNSSYRNFENRPFQSYFTTNKPTFIMSEWKLDHDNGYFLAGMMVRKCQNPEENNGESLEIITFTGSYKGRCEYDLDTLPIIEAGNRNKVLKGFGECKKVFEKMKMQERSDFNYYDMSSPHFRRQYFAKLKEYQIDNREWESIIKKVNLKESGLSELFANAKDERGLVENWFIDAIQNKLNGRHNRVKEFQKIAYQLIKQYRDNQVSIRRKKIIELFFQDAKEIRQRLEEYEQAQDALDCKKNEIAVFIQAVKQKEKELKENEIALEERIADLNASKTNIIREQISYKIYQLQEKKDKAVSERVESELRIVESRGRKEEIMKKICLYECAGLYQELMDFKKEKDKIQTNIRVATSKQKDMEQKVNDIGAALYAYYLALLEKAHVDLNDKEEKEKQLTKDKGNCEQQMGKVQECIEENQRKQGSLDEAIHGYDQVEQRFNKKHEETLGRNILGDYEEGLLEVRNQTYQDTLQEINLNITRFSNKSLKYKQEQNELIQRCEQNKREMGICEGQLTSLEKEYEEMQEEKNIRLTYMKYLEVSENEVDNKVMILSRFDGKLKELEQQKESYQDKWKVLKKEYDNLKQGKVIELPDSVKEYFEEENIEYIYGMEWLKNNGRTAVQNQELVSKNPFIPYCIILDAHMADKLANGRDDVYTSFPIPIVVREDLEHSYQSNGGCVNMGRVSFFVVFNHNLLNEEELKRILSENKKQQEELVEKIESKQKELDKYRNMRVILSEQTYTEDGIRLLKKNVKDKKEELRNLEQAYQTDTDRRKEINNLQTELTNEISNLKDKAKKLQEQMVDFRELLDAYQKYCRDRQERNRIINKIAEEKKQKEELKRKVNQLEEQLKNVEDEIHILKATIKDNTVKVEFYQNYSDQKSSQICEPDNVVTIEEEYKALTQGVARNIKELQENLELANKRYDKKEAELANKNQYGFEEKEYVDLIKSERIMRGLQEQLVQAQSDEDQANLKNNQLNSDITRLESDLAYEQENLIDKTKDSTLAEKKSIVDTNFEGRLQLAEYQIENEQKQLDKIRNQINTLGRAKDVMEEFNDFSITQEIEFSLEEMSTQELRRYQGTLRRDLNTFKDKREYQEKQMDTCIRNLAEKKEYQEEYFKRSFQNMRDVVNHVHHLKEQLEINCQAYNNSLQKLQVDLENIEKERNTIEESFLEYVKSIDDNLRMLDKNSTITLRGKNLRMLRIIVPDWESNRELYRIRLHDYVEHFVKSGIDSVEKNENVEELLGKLITTKKLYNEVVGTANIEIRLYKIEEEREVPITWSEVSANSGGEGFLSAFVILSCLLSYMRRDDTDLFSQADEGKVLIMDNPFAKTYSVHLLKPLMDIAKKTNTQLICLSGLGGDAIYNRFENIYVLKLTSSSLKKGLQYMEAKHIKGENSKKLDPAQFKIEQLSFL